MEKKSKDPILAFFLSLVLPGLGQVYAGKVMFGIFLLLAILGLDLGAVAYFLDPKTKVSCYILAPVVVSGILFLFSLFHAYRSASRYNSLNNQKKCPFSLKTALFITILLFIAASEYFYVAKFIRNNTYCLKSTAAGSINPDKNNLYSSYEVPPDSMEPTIYKGERVLVMSEAYKNSAPSRGDVIIYRNPREPAKICIHRIVGLPGELVELKDHRIIINQVKLTEAWATKIRHYNGGKLAMVGMKPILIPPDAYFVLGDNSARSQDSRHWGCLDKKYILGKVTKVYHPAERSRPVE